jgi:hypothetical protein
MMSYVIQGRLNTGNFSGYYIVPLTELHTSPRNSTFIVLEDYLGPQEINQRQQFNNSTIFHMYHSWLTFEPWNS